MFRLTVIIPFFNETPTTAFEETLATVLLHRSEEVEILVVNGGGYSDPWNVHAEGVRFLDLGDKKNPVDLINIAIEQSRGELIHFLYPGTEVTERWTETPLELFRAPETAIVIPCVYDRRKSKRIFALGIRYGQAGTLRTLRRSQLKAAMPKIVVPHVSAVFLRKSAVLHAGRFNRSFFPQLAFADTALRIREQGGETVIDPNCRITVRPNLLPATIPFSWGFQVERLYFRWLGRHHSFLSLGRHFGSFLVDFWRHFPRMKSFQLLAGRICGLCCCVEIHSSLKRHTETVPQKELSSVLHQLTATDPTSTQPNKKTA